MKKIWLVFPSEKSPIWILFQLKNPNFWKPKFFFQSRLYSLIHATELFQSLFFVVLHCINQDIKPNVHTIHKSAIYLACYPEIYQPLFAHLDSVPHRVDQFRTKKIILQCMYAMYLLIYVCSISVRRIQSDTSYRSLLLFVLF